MANQRRLQAPTLYPHGTIAMIGDSRTYAEAGAGAASDYPPCVIEQILSQQVISGTPLRVKCRNYGVSGNTTQQMWLRIQQILQFTKSDGTPEIPDILVVWGGVNDPGSSIPATGGTTGSPSSTQTYLQAIADFALAQGIKRVVICNEPPLSYVPSSGGDTAASTLGTYTYATLAAAQAAAVATFASGPDPRGTVVLCDLFTYVKTVLSASAPGTAPSALYQVAGNTLRSPIPYYQAANSLISAGNLPQPAMPTNYVLAWNLDSVPAAPYGKGIHAAPTGNIHQNPFGMSLIANAVATTIINQSGWLAALK